MPNAELRSASIALVDAATALSSVSDTPRLDAELLMAHGLGLDRSALLLRKADLIEPPGFADMVARRAMHEPVAYIIGHQDFWDLTLAVTPAVLIPRGDSETLIEAARDHFSGDTQPHSVADLGTGSGALLLAALSVFPNAMGIAIDASAAALAVASGNADALGFGERAQFLHLSWRQVNWGRDLLKANKGARFELLLCNPPYVESNAALSPSVRDHEPAAALFAGIDGFDDYRILIPQLSELLSRKGVAILEIGKGQDVAVTALAEAQGFAVTARRDLAGIIRALSLTQTAA
jgi:release factor glutamine methyltransferase